MSIKKQLELIKEQFRVNDNDVMVFDGPQDFIQAVHGTDILPDNFRFDTIAGLVDRLLEYDFEDFGELQYKGIEHEIIDGMVYVYNNDLVKWLSSNFVRADFVNEAASLGLIDTNNFDLFQALQVGQYLEIQMLLNNLLNILEGDLCLTE